MAEESAEDIAQRAAHWLNEIAPGAMCIAQEWDGRIDCVIRLPDGTIVGEMVPLRDVTESRIRATGERLSQRLAGRDAALINEIRSPVRIAKRD
jgi:hypothetical protein